MDVNEVIKKYSGKQAYCVYQLIKDGVVIYVGSSRQVSSRLYSHKISNIDFDSVHVDTCLSISDMYDLEAHSIVNINPKNNMMLPSSKKYKTTNECVSIAGITIANLVNDLPICFSRSRKTYIEADIYHKFISSIEEFAEHKLAEIEVEHRKKFK